MIALSPPGVQPEDTGATAGNRAVRMWLASEGGNGTTYLGERFFTVAADAGQSTERRKVHTLWSGLGLMHQAGWLDAGCGEHAGI